MKCPTRRRRAAPASDAAASGAASEFFFVSRLAPTRLSANRPDSGRIGPYRANSVVFRPEKENRPVRIRAEPLSSSSSSSLLLMGSSLCLYFSLCLFLLMGSSWLFLPHVRTEPHICLWIETGKRQCNKKAMATI